MPFLPSSITFESPSFIIIAYLLLCITCLKSYLILYRLIQSSLHPTLPPFFHTNHSRNIHLSLLSNHSSSSNTPASFPPHILKASLFLHAKEVISRIRILKDSKKPAMKLLEQEYITHYTIDMMRLAERDLHKEIEEIKGHASVIGGDEWASVIMDQANEYWLKEEVLRVFDKWTTQFPELVNDLAKVE
jgi:hypothetical protein